MNNLYKNTNFDVDKFYQEGFLLFEMQSEVKLMVANHYKRNKNLDIQLFNDCVKFFKKYINLFTENYILTHTILENDNLNSWKSNCMDDYVLSAYFYFSKDKNDFFYSKKLNDNNGEEIKIKLENGHVIFLETRTPLFKNKFELSPNSFIVQIKVLQKDGY